jgi:uncharacterized membrane protein
MVIFYRLLFSIPAIAAAASLLIAWNSGLLRRPLVAIVWFFLGLLLQTIGVLFAPAWAVGLVIQVALAIYLVIKMRTNTPTRVDRTRRP